MTDPHSPSDDFHDADDAALDQAAISEAAPEARAGRRLPVVAIVGRPNVGKSRLFNRFIGRREAIVEDVPGVTRDRNYGHSEWYDKRFSVIDTGGFEPDSDDNMLEQMREQATLAIEEADAIVFVVDGRAGLLPNDDLIARLLRQTEKPVYVAVNKLDTYDLASESAEFYALGLGDVYPISAEHGVGYDELMDALTEGFAADPDAEPGVAAGEDAPIHIAVVGKPNAGKSTLINRLLGADRLLTSDVPGTTRDAIDTLLEREVEVAPGRPESADDGEMPTATRVTRQYLLIDTAGIRRKRSISQRLEKYSVVQAIKSLERADVALLVIDVVEGISDQDARIARLAVDRGCALAILLNKWDALPNKETNTARDIQQAIRDRLPSCDYAPIITLSALTGQRAHRVLDVVDRLVVEARRRVSTAEVNRALEQIVAKHAPPMGRHRPVKFYYGSQVAAAPPTFVLQVNSPRDVPRDYRRYLTNQLRALWGFEGSPIRLILRRPRGRHRWDEAP